MSRHLLIALVAVCAAAVIAASAFYSRPSQAGEPVITVHRTPWCGCCGDWVDHLREQGFAVTVHEHEDLSPVRTRLEVPVALGSCHTAEVDGYAIEGHVPASDIRRLLQERPEGVRGLSVPGMPVGSPGMEVGDRKDPFDVVAFGEDGTAVFNEYRP
ncbi:MAG: DUF411 domain-containing protein [Pseudomonadales bacterium]